MLRLRPQGQNLPVFTSTGSGICPYCHTFIKKGSVLVRLPEPEAPFTFDGRKNFRTGQYWYYDGRHISTRPRRYVHRSCYLEVLVETSECVYCGVNDATAIDHVIPRFIGGSDDLTNLVPACTSCNSRKGTLPVELVAADPKTVALYLVGHGFVPLTNSLAKTSRWRHALCPDKTDGCCHSFTRAAAVMASHVMDFEAGVA